MSRTAHTAPTTTTPPATTSPATTSPTPADPWPAAPTTSPSTGTEPVYPSLGGPWAWWGVAAGALGMVATMFTDTRPPEDATPIGHEDVFRLDATPFHLGIAAGLAATFCVLVTASAWRRWARRHAPDSLAAGLVPQALTASAGAMLLAYGLKGSLAVYLPGGMDEGSYTSEGLFSIFLFLDFAPYIAWWGVCFAAVALGWLALRERLLPRWLGWLSVPFTLAPIAFMATTGLPGFPGVVDPLWLTLASAGLLLGDRRSRR